MKNNIFILIIIICNLSLQNLEVKASEFSTSIFIRRYITPNGDLVYKSKCLLKKKACFIMKYNKGVLVKRIDVSPTILNKMASNFLSRIPSFKKNINDLSTGLAPSVVASISWKVSSLKDYSEGYLRKQDYKNEKYKQLIEALLFLEEQLQ